MDGVLDADVLAVPLDIADIEDIFEIVEDTDSLEPRLASWSEGLLGGRAGDGCDECCLGGNRGGGWGLAVCCGAAPVRVMVGGGRTPFLRGPLGSLPTPLFAFEVSRPVVETLLGSIVGRSGMFSSLFVAVIGARPT